MELAQSFGMRTAHGALVSRILPDSPAEASELQVGDVITHFEGQRIGRSSALPPLVGRVPANSDAALKVIRDGQPVELTVNIAELPDDDTIRQSVAPASEPRENRLAMTVETLDDETREALGVDRGGVLVDSVKKGGPADRAGIESGDAVLTIDNKSVDSPEDFEAVLAEIDDRESIAVLVQQGGEPVFLALTLE